MLLVKTTAIPGRIAVFFLVFLVTVVLAACSDSTPTPAATSPAATSSFALPPTNINQAGSGAVLPNANTSPVTNGTDQIPTVTNANSIQLDQDLLASTVHLVPGVSNPTIQILASSDISTTLAANIDNTFVEAGYKFVFPGFTKPTLQGANILGLYSKLGAADILLSVSTIPTNAALVNPTLGLPNLSQDSGQKFLDQVKGKKSAAVLIAAKGLIQGVSTSTGFTPPADMSNATAVATIVKGTAGPTATPEVSEQDIPVYPSARRAQTNQTTLGDTTTVSYVSSDDYAKITAWAKQAFTDKGWEAVATNEQAGATTVTGRKGKYSLIATILGPQSRTNGGFATYFNQANAGPNDSVIVVVITH